MGKDLAQRVEQNAVQQRGGRPSIEQDIRAMEREFALAMPKGAEAVQLVRDAITLLRTTRHLAECDKASILGGLMTCAQLGLRPGVLGHAWLLPFWKSKHHQDESGRWVSGYSAQLVIGYQGLVDLAHRSGKIASLIARTVYSNDTFDVDYGLADSLVHKPALRGSRGEPIAYYAIAKFTTGGHAFIVITHDEMEEYRDRYATAKTRDGRVVGPWAEQFEGMAHKTCLRQLAKFMPKSTELAVALAADEGIRVDLSPQADPVHATVHEDVIDVQPEDVHDEVVSQSQEPAAERPAAKAPRRAAKASDGGEETITQAQQRALHAILRKAVGNDREAGLVLIAQELGLDSLGSTEELSKAQASTAIEKLQAIVDAQAKPAAQVPDPADVDKAWGLAEPGGE